MHVVLNQFDGVGYYELFDLESSNKGLTKNKNVQGTVIFATSKIQYDPTKHKDCTKNEKPKPPSAQRRTNPLSYPVEAEETKFNSRMPLEDFVRNNFTNIILAAYCLGGYYGVIDMNDYLT